jgi:GNAT superfamily N-acetyltransferase
VGSVAPLFRLIVAMDDLLERTDPQPWGAVVTESRLPLIYDANYARLDGPLDVALDEVEAVLIPALDRSGARFVHVVTLAPEATPRLMADARARRLEINVDSAMRLGTPRRPPKDHDVRVRPPDADLWADVRVALPEFDVRDPRVIDQVVTWQREILAPAGKRWFSVELDGKTAGMGSLFVRAGVAYVDDVITMPSARRRGVASAIVMHMADVAYGEGAEHVYLLADEPGPIRLYEGLGFETVGEVASVLEPLA